MYATSKLIIPPKPARNSPYIPKLRIKLKPSLSRNRLVHGTSLRNGALVQIHRDVSLRSNSRCLSGGIRNPKAEAFSIQSEIPRKEERTESTGIGSSDGDTSMPVTRRSGSKRKQAPLEMDQPDLEGPESILTKISLKALINRDTFYAFPIETQKMLADLLPFYDRQKQSWSSVYSSTNGYASDDTRNQNKLATTISPGDDKSIWLHPSALNNEFFTKALQDYADRQARGEFAPRLRNRAGLRANAATRGRYSSALLNTDLVAEKQTAKHKVADAGSRYNLVRRTTRTKNKTFTTCMTRRTNSYRSSRTQIQADSGVESSPSPSTENSIIRSPTRNHNKSAFQSKDLSYSVSRLNRASRMKLRQKSNRSKRSDRTSSEDSLPSTQTIPNDEIPILNFSDHCPVVSSHVVTVSLSSSANDTYTMSNAPTMGSETPPLKPTKHSLSEFPNSTMRGSLSHTSLSSPKGMDLCDGMDTSYSLAHIQKQDESIQSLKISRQPNYPLSTSSSESKCSNTIGSPRTGRIARGIGALPNSTVPPSMPPPRQTKTLAAMREKLRAKRMLKEAERHPSGTCSYPFPGSMTPHPASGSCGYFHQPIGYPSSGSGFGSPLLASVGCKRSSSALGSPQNLNSASPTNCDKQLCNNTPSSVSLSTLLNGANESTAYKLIPSSSPSSPHSLPNAELSSPLLNSSLSNDFLSHISLQDSTFGQDFSGQSYPSSPLSTNSSGGLFAGSAATGSAYSPQSAKMSVAYSEMRQEQSVSAPPTPVLPQAGQTMLTFSPLLPASSLSSTLSSALRPSYQTTSTTTLATIPSVSSSLPALHTSYSQVNNAFKPVFSSVASTSSVHSNSTVVLSINSNVVPHSTLATNLQSSPTVSELRTSHSYPVLTACSSCVSSTMAPTHSSISMDSTRSPQVTTCTTPSLSTQLSASAAVTKFLVGSSQNRPSTTTRAFFVDGDNLSEAVALLQSLNPKATITQQQFLLIPSSNKSQMFLCPTPSTSNPNILSVPVSNSAPPIVSTNGTSPVTAVTTPTTKSNPTTTQVASFMGVRQLAVSALSPTSSQNTPVGQVVPNTTAIPTVLDPNTNLNQKTTNVVLSGLTAHTIPSTSQATRSLICTKSVMSYPHSTAPNMVQLKPQTKSPENPPERAISKSSAIVMPRRTIVHVTKSLNETVYAAPATQSQQIAFSLLATRASGLHTDTNTPVVFVSETNPTAYAPRQLNFNAIQSPVSLLDRNQSLINATGAMSITSSAVTSLTGATPGPVAASAHMTVINPTQLTATCDIQLQSQHQRIHSVPTQLHCSPVGPEHTVQAIRANSISYANTMGTVPTTYLSAATIVSPCLPAVVLPHTLTVQPPRPNVINSVNGTDHTLFRSVP